MSSEAGVAAIADLRAMAPAVAVLCDVDGTLAPIVGRAADAAITTRCREALYALTRHYSLVACVSGRRALDARRIVGLDELHYIGNHGFEELEPGAAEPVANSALGSESGAARRFVDDLDPARFSDAGIEIEDKGPIQALHWRRSDTPEQAESSLTELAERAQEEGLVVHWGRRILELRPATPVDKGIAVEELLGAAGLRGAFYVGDDRTDLDAFAALRRLAADGRIEKSVCAGVISTEGPAEIRTDADLTLDFDDVVPLLENLGGF